MQIKKTIEKVPGGMMVVPLVLGAVIHTVWPHADTELTGITGSFMMGTSVTLFIFFLAVGTNINLKSSGKIAAKGMNLLLTKVILAAIIAIILNHFMATGGIKTGLFAGFSVLAVLASFNAANGGLYVALMSTLPNREVDVAAYPFTSIESGPFFTMITLGLAGIASFPWQALVSTLVPFIIGIVLGSLDPELKALFSPMQGGLVPFFAFSIGYSLSLKRFIESGLVGILMGVAVVFISGAVMAFTDKHIVRSDGLAGWAQSGTAGASVTIPVIIAQMNPEFKTVASSATAIVATSVLVTAILTPIVTMQYYKHLQKKGLVEQQS